jgi:F-type H+-transporting ATPase subunit b
LIAGLIAFVIIFLFVWKWVLPHASRALEARQQAIKGELDAAEKSKLEAQSLLDDYRQQVSGAREEANRIIEEARQAGEALRADMVARAESDAAEITRKARDDAAAERERLEGAIRAQVADLSLSLAEKAVQGSIDAKAQKKLVDQYIKDLSELEA